MTSIAEVRTASVHRPGRPLGAVVAIACVAQFMVVLDGTIVNVALPDLRGDLGLTAASQQWVVTSYLIGFGGLLLLAARAGDLLGRRRVFATGLVLFTGASLVGGLAGGPAVLLAARAVQGVGAAALAPASLSLITASHPERELRTRALSLWSAAAASAGAASMVLGGVLVDRFGWRAVFFVNVPVGLALLGASFFVLAAAPAARKVRLSVPDALVVTSATAALVYGVSQVAEAGWGSRRVVVALCLAVVLTTAFVLLESRSARPLIPPAVYRHRPLRVGNLISLVLGAVMTSTVFFLSVYEQQVLGYSPLLTGLSLVPWTLLLIAGTFAGRRLLPRFGAVTMLVTGLLLTAAGLVWLGRIPAAPAYLTHVLGPTLLTGLGTSLAVLPNTVTATEGVRPAEAGLVSGLMNMSRQIGGAVGLAATVTIAEAATVAVAGHHGVTAGEATVHGYHVALLTAAGLSAVAAALAVLHRGSR